MVSKKIPTATSTSPRMTLAHAKVMVADFGDRKLLAPRVRHMLAYTGFSTAEVAEKIFALYAGAKLLVPAGFGATSMDTAMLVARTYESTLAGKGLTKADETLVFECMVTIARAQVKDGGAKPGLEATCQAAMRKRSREAVVIAVADAETAVTRAANARRVGTRVAATVIDTPDGRAAIESHDESAKEAQVGETKAERKARTAGDRVSSEAERKAAQGGNKGSGPVTPRTPESGPDPLAHEPGNTTDQLAGQNPAPTGNRGPAKVKALADATTVDLIRTLRASLGAGLIVTTTLDEMFQDLVSAWEERATETPASATPAKEREATAARLSKVATVKAGKRVRASEPTPEPSGRVGMATEPYVPGTPAHVARAAKAEADTALARAFREAALADISAVMVGDIEAHVSASA